MNSQPQRLGNRYILQEMLGQGAMGAVYRAYDRLTGNTVAVKRVLIKPAWLVFGSHTPDSDNNLALAREFQTLASLRHPNIISVLDYGFDENRQPFFSMSLLENAQDVRTAASQRNFKNKVHLLIEILQALAYLHRREVVHRDLKPRNILVDTSNTVKVLDFGLAVQQATGEDAVGTVPYMAPELLDGQAATKASDLYSIGVMAFEFFAGRHPFNMQTPGELIYQILNEQPDFSLLQEGETDSSAGGKSDLPLPDSEPTVRLPRAASVESTSRPIPAAESAPVSPSDSSLPPEPLSLSAIVARLMAKNPAQRYANAEMVIEDLSTLIGEPASQESAAVRESFLQAAKFVGRDTEIALLNEALNQTLTGQGSTWLIAGESGVGKSRLLDELRIQAMVKGMVVLHGQENSGSRLSYQLWRDSIRRLLLSTTLSDLEAGVLKEIVPDIANFLRRDVPDAPVLESATAQVRLALTIADVFRQQSSPILLLLEDLHWAGESLKILKYLNRIVGEIPLLIVANYRDDETRNMPETFPEMRLIELKRLNDSSIEELSYAMLGEIGNQQHIVQRLKQETEGNAYFLVEVVRALAEEAGRLRDVGQIDLPEHIFTGGMQAVIQRRLARVPDSAQPLLKLAAVAGRQINLKLIQAIVPETDLNQWYTQCANVAVLDTYGEQMRFAHDKLRDAVLTDLAQPERRRLHQQVAQGLEQVYGGDASYAAQLASHWREVGDTQKESHYLHLAGAQAYRTSNFSEVKAMYTRLLTLLPEISDNGLNKAAILITLAHVHREQGDFPPASQYYHEALTLARSSQDRLNEMVALGGVGQCLSLQGNYTEATPILEEAIAIARLADDKNRIVHFFNILILAGLHSGNMPVSRTYAESCLELLDTVDDLQVKAAAFKEIGNVSMYAGELDQAQQYMESAVAIASDIGNRRLLASCLVNLGSIGILKQEWEVGQANYDRAMAVIQQLGDRQTEALAYYGKGQAAYNLAAYEKAVQDLSRAVTISRDIGYRVVLGASLAILIYSHLRLGQSEPALSYLPESLQTSYDIHVNDLIAESLAGYAWYYQQMGNLEKAVNIIGFLEAYRPNVLQAASVYQEIGHVTNLLTETVPADQFAIWMEQGKTIELETLLKELLPSR